MDLLGFHVFSCFFNIVINAILHYKFKKQKKVKIMFSMFSRMNLTLHLTKYHDCSRILRHFWLANKGFPKMGLHIITSVSCRQNHQKSQNFHFLDFLEHFKRTQDARSVLNFVIFDDFGSLIMKICKFSWAGFSWTMHFQ